MDATRDRQGIGYQGGPDDPREIGKWARTYAQNRTLPFIVFMFVFLLLCAAIAGGSYLAAWAHLSGNRPLLVACIVWLVLAVAADIYISVLRWGGKWTRQIAQRLYAKEGSVAVTHPHTAGQRRLGLPVGLVFCLCIVAQIALGILGYIPDKYMQPVSALYLVPFLIILSVLQRPTARWLTLLWPGLYTLHAILIVAGAPILFTGRWTGLNMLIPTAGYGLLYGFVGHVYSRFALRKLKRLARTELPAGDGHGRVKQP